MAWAENKANHAINTELVSHIIRNEFLVPPPTAIFMGSSVNLLLCRHVSPQTCFQVLDRDTLIDNLEVSSPTANP